MVRISGMTGTSSGPFKQNPDRWSVGECVRAHRARPSRRLLGEGREGGRRACRPRVVLPHRRATGADQSIWYPTAPPQGQGGVQAPEQLQPTQRWARARSRSSTGRTATCARSSRTMNREIKNRTESSPPFGWLNAHDSLVSLALHTVRHTRQIAEVQADPGYPKKPAAPAASRPQPRPDRRGIHRAGEGDRRR